VNFNLIFSLPHTHKDAHNMNEVFSKKSLAAITLASAAVSLFAAVPAHAIPESDCVVSASFDGYCLVQPGITVTGVLKGGNGGPGGFGGNGGNAFSGGFLGGLGGAGGIGGAGAKVPFIYTNTSGSAVTLHFAIGLNGAPGTAGIDGISGTPITPYGTDGSSGSSAANGTLTLLEENSVPLVIANPGTGGEGGTGGTGATTTENGVFGIAGGPGTAGDDSTLDTAWFEAPFASIVFVGIPSVDPVPDPTPTLAVTGQNAQQEGALGFLMGTLFALGAAGLVARRRIAAKK
jgi:hypothetical protein